MSLLTPVRYPVRHYSWEDADSPQLSDGDGVIKTILKACLITGYGSKEGAGWQLLEEDGDMMVIKRPSGIGNPPDIRIENGQVGTENKHRIVAQDDTGELVSLNMLARDGRAGKEWHLIVCDFGFLLCYQMGMVNTPISNQNLKKSVMYVGSLQKLIPSDNEPFVIGMANGVATNGNLPNGIQAYPITNGNYLLINVATKINIIQRFTVKFTGSMLSENHAGGYVAQPIWVSNVAKMPLYTALFAPQVNQVDGTTSIINIAGRRFLRYVHMPSYSYNGVDVLYIPLDYWEL